MGFLILCFLYNMDEIRLENMDRCVKIKMDYIYD